MGAGAGPPQESDQPSLSPPPQGSQDATAPPEAMAQPYPPAQYPPPPPHPTQDYSGQTPVPPEHGMTLYTPAQTHPEQPGPEASTQPIAGAQTVPVRGPLDPGLQEAGPPQGRIGGSKASPWTESQSPQWGCQSWSLPPPCSGSPSDTKHLPSQAQRGGQPPARSRPTTCSCPPPRSLSPTAARLSRHLGDGACPRLPVTCSWEARETARDGLAAWARPVSRGRAAGPAAGGGPGPQSCLRGRRCYHF